ncbi:MAG TPA: hypothetical protein VJP89_00975 [Pyrinomonadaceae bacterium]|nr:hypothetical protein [Pyrinomonadaceae bacterium]
MNPHKLTLKVFLLLILVFGSAENSFPQRVTVGRRGIVVDERLAALRRTPNLSGQLVRRLGRGRIVYIRNSRTTPDGVVFYLVSVTSRTHGWIQREAVTSPTHPRDDRRLLDLIEASQGFDQIVRARIFLDHFPRSPLRPQVLLLLGNTTEEQAAKLSREAAKRLSGTTTNAPDFTYFLNYTGLDRYNRQRVTFIFNPTTRRFHYDGAAWRELLRRYPKSPEALEARQRLAELAQLDP